MLTRRVLVVLVAIFSSCSPPLPIENPTGSCPSQGSGARPGYHEPQGIPWMVDCQLPLRRSYWRVFVQSSTQAYILPRPDGHPLLAAACADSAQPLRDVVDRNALCGANELRINDIPPADAMTLTQAFHQNLRFVTSPSGVTPAAVPPDLLDACALADTSSPPAFVTTCDRERARGSNDILVPFTGPAADEMARRLNELYGIH